MAHQLVVDTPDDRLEIHDFTESGSKTTFEEDVRRGLSAPQKFLLPKYFYDALGSELFDAICLLPEYYLTRAEDEILATHADEIASFLTGQKTLLEMGSGSAVKTRQIIEALLRRQRTLEYVPVDISASALEQSSRVLLQSYPEISVRAYASDYYGAIRQLKPVPEKRTLALFLGSNIGNFDREEARSFLSGMRSILNSGDGLLLGVDLKKDRETLEAAYDDSLGVTAAFNLNLLLRINREMGANFDLRAFSHHAFYNEAAGKVEIHIKSLRAQTVSIKALDMEIQLESGERIHTENSHKYDLSELSGMAESAGFHLARTWFDTEQRFSSNMLVAV